MKIYNIENINNKISVGDEIKIKMVNDKKENIKKLKILDYCGEGGYGTVFKCDLNEVECVIKLSTNENPEFLKGCYKHLKKDLKEFVVDITYAGELINNEDDYNYYSIMNYGGKDLKHYNFSDESNKDNSYFIIQQLFLLSKKICKTKKMVMDFKLSNILLDKYNKITITDIYFESDNFKSFNNCKIFRTNAILDINVIKSHKEHNYNFTYIYVLLMFIFINIFCVDSLNNISQKIIKELKLDIDTKKFTNIIQLSYYSKFNHKDMKIKSFLKTNKKNLKIKNFNNIYDLFNSHIKIKKIYSDILNKNEFVNILDNILIPIPEYRDIEPLKKFMKKIKITL